MTRLPSPRPALLHVCGTYLPLSETFTYDLIRGLLGFEHHVVASRVEHLTHFPLDHVHVPEPEERAWTLARSIDARTIVCHFGPQATMGMPIALAVDRPAVTLFHGYDLSRLLRDRRWVERYRAVARLGMQALCISGAGRQRLLDIGWPASQIEVIRLGVDAARFTFRPPSVRWGSRGPRRILMVARLVEKKGVHVALDALRRLRARGLDLELRVIGDGPERARLEQAIGEARLSSVTLLGALEHERTRRELADADLYIQPSVTARSGDQEGIPVSLMEAQASGLPVVSTRHSGIPELVIDGVTGLLTDEGDSEALATSIERLVHEPERAQQLADAALARVRREFDRERQTRRFSAYLEDLAQDAARRPSVYASRRPRPTGRGLLLRSIPVGQMARKLLLLSERHPDVQWEVLTSQSSAATVSGIPLVSRVWSHGDGRLSLRTVGRTVLRDLAAAGFERVLVPYRDDAGAGLAHVRRVAQVVAPDRAFALTLHDLEHRLPRTVRRLDLDAVCSRPPRTKARPTPHCPCCGRDAAEFLPFGVPPRPRARCPFCGSVERHRLLWMFLQSRPALFAGRCTLLHVAPEPVLADLFKGIPGLRYISGDLALDSDVRLDVTALPFADGSIDAVICSHVLEHVAADGRAMREFRRVLSPRGWAILQAPIDRTRDVTYEDASITDPAAREGAFGQHDHVRVYGLDYYDRLEHAGFQVERVPFTRNLDRPALQRYALRHDDIVICRRAA